MKCSDFIKSVNLQLSALIESGSFAENTAEARQMLSQMRGIEMAFDGWFS